MARAPSGHAALATAERWLVSTNRWVLIVGLAAMATLVFANVVSRYLLNYSFSWVEELTRYMMIWLCLLGSGLALRYGAHIAVDVLQDLLPRAAARALRALILAVLAITLVVLIWLGFDYAEFGWYQETPVMNWSFGMVYLAIPIGCVLMLVHLLFIAKGFVLDRQFDHDTSFRAEDAAL